jgi:hypothetical protein
MGLTLSQPPGYSDLSDPLLVANSPALGIDFGKISENAAFGMVRTEIFNGLYSNGETVALPVSPIDGYPYSRNELLYFWTIRNSTSPTTHWISAGDSLFYCAWNVDQTTGDVASFEVYRRSGNHANVTGTNDGLLEVWTVAQRQLSNLIMAASPSYSAITGSTVAQDKPLTQLLAQSLNDNAKFGVVNSECFYLGDYYDGQTVVLPHSPDDGYAYSAAECNFMFSWKWTSQGNSSVLLSPPLSNGQLGPMQCSINSSGVVSIDVWYIDNSGGLFDAEALGGTDGLVSVFAFTKRSGTPATITPTANQFAELSLDLFMPGSDLAFGTVQQVIKNTTEALLTPEFFGPTTHADGDTIAVPTSAVDGYVYSRSELQYLWTWSDTTNQTGTHLRLPAFYGSINQSTGVVTLHVFRLPPGGPIVEDNDTLCRISVLIVARRAAQAPTVLPANAVSTQGGTGSNTQFDVPTVSTLAGQALSGTGTSFTLTSGTAVFLVWNGQLRFDFSQSGTAITTTFTVNSGDTLYAVFTT